MTYEKLQRAYGEHSLSRAQVFRWHKPFLEGREQVEDEPRMYVLTKTYDIFVNCSWVATLWQQYSTHLHTNDTQNDTKQTIQRTTQKFWKSAGRALSLRVLPWHLPYNRGKSTEKPQSG